MVVNPETVETIRVILQDGCGTGSQGRSCP